MTKAPQMAVLTPAHDIGKRLAAVFAKHGIPLDVAKENRNRVSVDKPAVRLLSMHSANGSEGSSSRAWRSAAWARSAGTAR